MTVMIQVRNVPTDLHRTMKARAAKEGMSLSEYMLRLAEQDAAKPTMAEMRARLEAMPPIELAVDIAELIREERDSR